LYKLFEILVEHCICIGDILGEFVRVLLGVFEVFVVASIESRWFAV
jgi:hypothetical protein